MEQLDVPFVFFVKYPFVHWTYRIHEPMVAPDGMCELFLCDKRNLKGPVGQLHGLMEHKGRARVVLLFSQELKALKEFIDLYILTFPRFSGKPYTAFQVKSIMDNREIRAFLFVDQ